LKNFKGDSKEISGLRKKMMEVSGGIHKKNEQLFLLKQNEKDFPLK